MDQLPPPLPAGATREGSPEPFRDELQYAGVFLWIAQLSAEGWGEIVGEDEERGVEARVLRVRAAMARFVRE